MKPEYEKMKKELAKLYEKHPRIAVAQALGTILYMIAAFLVGGTLGLILGAIIW